ncbi:putative Ig domain-containing protein [Oleiharenicola lentus]|uniref:putative Ig domain-containing protein n=1 Tax=Oleiharenicola lentus TaxID=2508720 RepID=UPI003F663E64
MISRINSLTKTLWLILGFAVLATAAHAADVTLPAGQAGVAYTPYNIPFTPTPAPGTTYAATNLPNGLSINATSGTFSGTPTQSGVFAGVVSLTEGANVNNFTYSLTIAAALGTPQITSSLTALGAVGSEFVSIVTASNSPTSFNVGALPAGLSFNSSSAQIVGTPTTAGTYPVSLSANNASGTGASVTLSITIEPSGPVPAITSAAAVSADLNTPFNYQIVASNSPTSYSTNGLPVGLSLNTTSGLISGTPTVAGVSTTTLTATNGNGTSANFTLTLTLGPVSVINSAATLTGYAGAAITPYQFTATNSPLSFNVGALPSGLSYSSSTKQITGTPAAVGTTSVAVTANNATGTGPNFQLSIVISAPTAPTITTHPVSQTKNAGEAVTFTVAVTGAPAPTFQWKKGGNAINLATSSSYTITGLATGDAGDYTVTVTNVGGSVTSDIAVLVVNAAGLEAWRAANFNSTELGNLAVSGPNAVFGVDGLSNLVKYALGLNPKVNITSGLPEVTTTSTEWVYTYTRPADRADLSYAVEASTNLTTWSASGVTHELVSSAGGNETWRARLALAGNANAFFRLRVIRN